MRKKGKGLTQRVLRATYYLFLAAGAMTLVYVGYAVAELFWFQRVEMSKFETISASARAEPHAIGATLIPEGGMIGEIQVPRLGLKAIVVQGDSEKLLGHAVGHLPNTALPGKVGNVALAGHRDGLFRPLRDVRPGDSIILSTKNRDFQYQVEWTAVVPPTAVGVIEPTRESALTLITCFPFSFIGPAPDRFVVRARAISPRVSSALRE
jgi:sortase A